jgi:hypothetical protein
LEYLRALFARSAACSALEPGQIEWAQFAADTPFFCMDMGGYNSILLHVF